MGSNNNGEPMDDEQPGVAVREDEQYLKGAFLAGPMTLGVCLYFIMLSQLNELNSERNQVYLEQIQEHLSTNSTDFDDEIEKLQKLSQKYCLKINICIINQNEKHYYDLHVESIPENQQLFYAYLVFDKPNRSFYPFYVRNNNKIQAHFSTSDTRITRLFEDATESYPWPYSFNQTNQLSFEDETMAEEENDAPKHLTTMNHNFNIDDRENQKQMKTDVFGACNVLLQNIKQLVPFTGHYLDRFKRLYQLSDYQLTDACLESPKVIYETCVYQVQRLLKILDPDAEIVRKDHTTSTPIDCHTTSDIISNEFSSGLEPETLLHQSVPNTSSLALNYQLLNPTTTSGPSNTSINTPPMIKLRQPVLLNQPRRLWHNRELASLKTGCPAIQIEGAPQRTQLLIGLPEKITEYQNNIFLGIHVKTFNGGDHTQKLVVPVHAKIRNDYKSQLNKLECIMYTNQDNNPIEFDRESRGVFSKINSDDIKLLETKLSLKMLNLYQDENNDKKAKKENKLTWCRFMFAFYTKLPNNCFQRVSESVYSDLIEETSGSQSFSITSIFPAQLCRNGGQMIFIPLTPTAKKEVLQVWCNGEQLHKNNFQSDEKLLSFESPVWMEGKDELTITIFNTTTQSYSTFKLTYIPHDEHPGPCGVIT